MFSRRLPEDQSTSHLAEDASSADTVPCTLEQTSPSILWRIVFAQTAFCIQISNNLGGPRPAWMTVSDKTEDIVIPPEYFPQLGQLSSHPLLLNRYVTEKRSVPKHFTSYQEARVFIAETLGLSDSQEWHPNIVLPRKRGWKGWFRRR